ncbi:MAG TPA: ABC transporter ATP-binding protein [Pyrinomonadaceae bacterium]|nr:ABC transporter ATP-binding protein [Pyrinomonadaceae bacterium]
MHQTVLQTQQLTRRFGRRTVVDQLSLTVESGDVFGFLGQNGAGKSTTIRMILGLVRPTSGQVTVLGHDIRRHPRRALKRIGAIVETPAFYENFSGRQNLQMLAAMSGGAKPERIESVLELVNLRQRAGDPVRVYSHGMRQRLGIAQALLPNPELIILDEPTDGLDPQGLFDMRELICRLRNELGLTIVLSTHLLHEVEQICNRVAIIDAGRLLYQGSVADLLQVENVVRLRVDRLAEARELLSRSGEVSVSSNGDAALHLKMDLAKVPQINALLVRNGFEVMELSPQRESLEQVFLRLTREARIRPDESA